MTPEEYALQQAAITAAVVQFVKRLASLFTGPALSTEEWVSVLSMVYSEVQRGRSESAELGRRFYDEQRKLYHPNETRNDTPLEGSTFQTFVVDMDPVRKAMVQEQSPAEAVDALALRVARSVENAGRKQIIRCVETDKTGVLRGWTRVATGRETCAWCLMLISRGPTYLGSDTAGLGLTDTEALARYRESSDLDTFFESIEGHMKEWHTGCDCKVIPVFKRKKWFGEANAESALQAWMKASTEADELIESGKSRTGNRNREAINALRRRLERGDLNINEFAALAA